MDQRAIIDVVFKTGFENLADKLRALFGQDLTCSDVRFGLASKKGLFDDPQRGKSTLARMKVSGDQESQSYLLTGLATAAFLGGTLIMLPQDMIEENASSDELEGELKDAFGEVVNVIAVAFTQAFADKYEKTIRFDKNTLEELIPTQINLDKDEPFPPGQYYVASCRLNFGERDLGALEFITPAAIFGLGEKPATEATARDDTNQSTANRVATPAAEASPATDKTIQEIPSPSLDRPKKPFAKAKKLTDSIFKTTILQAGEGIGALLGQTMKCDGIQLLMTGKEEFFSQHCIDKSVMTRLQIRGAKEGFGYLFAELPDAVVLGATLIMLPDEEIEEQKSSGAFEGEVADAYGEIANILAGRLNQVFHDRYPQPIRFVKTDSATVVPSRVDPANQEPFPEGRFYLASFAIHLEGRALSRMQLVFPAEIFDLDEEIAAGSPQQLPESVAKASHSARSGGPAPGEWGGSPLTQSGSSTRAEPAVASIPTDNNQRGAPDPAVTEPLGDPPLVLVISDQPGAAGLFTETLNSAGYHCQALSFQDELKQFLRNHQLLGIFLIMSQVGEKGFAAAIKLQSAGRPLPPLIFAGPEWTRSAVLRAVKYGARDILVMPASSDEIQKKATRHLKKAS